MRSITRVEGIACPIFRPDIDTDQIVPRPFLVRIDATGYGDALFHGWRFDPHGRPDPAFPLNQPAWRQARILVAGPNFGCGSSREHAVWAIRDYGIDVVIAPSFGDIFRNNCGNGGVLAVELPTDAARDLAEALQAEPALPVAIDLEAQTVSYGRKRHPFAIDAAVRHRLLNGLDAIEVTLQSAGAIADYERRRPDWLASRGVA